MPCCHFEQGGTALTRIGSRMMASAFFQPQAFSLAQTQHPAMLLFDQFTHAVLLEVVHILLQEYMITDLAC
jgi:hypothetical protein